MKLATRVSLAVTTLTALSLAVSFVAVSLSVYRSELRDLDQILLMRAQAVLERTSAEPSKLRVEGKEATPETGVPTPRYAALYGRDGAPLAFTGFRPAPPRLEDFSGALTPPRQGLFIDLSADRVDLRGVVLPASDDGRLLLYAVSRAAMDAEWRFLNRAATVIFLAATLVTSLVASWIGRRMSRALQSVASVARAVAEGDLDARVGPTQGATETRRLASDIDHMIEQIRALVVSQRTFASHAAHELRSPLTTIRGELQLALRRERSSDEYRATIGQVLGDVESLTSLAEELLVLARAQAKPEEHRAVQPVSAAEVVREVLHMVRGTAKERGVALVPELSAGVEEPCLMGSHSELVRALRNLVDNAVARAPQDSAVRVGVDRRDQHVVISVEDAGHGVPPGDRKNIFEPFFRGSKDQAGDLPGAGLGLTIARDIARNHGGSVGLESKQGPGARFVLQLPYARRAT